MNSPLLILLSLLAPSPDALVESQQPLALEEIPTGLTGVVDLTFAPGDDAGRMFLVRKSGEIFIVENDVRLPAPFLDIQDKVTSPNSQGLLGMAFHPEYEQNGYFYVNYTDKTGGDTVIERYRVSRNNPNAALPGSALKILTIDQPDPLHNGGWLEFGPDGYLYVAMGDGGPPGDPAHRAQNGKELLGKMLRLDVDNPAPGRAYGIPPSNPFIQDPNVLDEVWALGLRNPWRCDFDAATGDLWITDVGNARWEELNVQPAGVGGSNYGWSIVEGEHCFAPPSNCNTTGLTPPLFEYEHGGAAFRCSIIGGAVYRGSQMADMHGRFFYSDYCSNQTWSLRQAGGAAQDLQDHTAELLTPDGDALEFIVTLAEDADGEIYILQGSARSLYRVIPARLRLQVPALTAGATVNVRLTGGRPQNMTGLFIGLAGLGVTNVPYGGLNLGIAQARLVATTTTGASGAAVFSGRLPDGMQDRTIWWQAAQRGLPSNISVRTVN
jgi:glucose/arabinose dehydrogenase